jgi:uncharacterized protein (DUF1330 family)
MGPEEMQAMSSYLVYTWQVAPAVYPENIDVLVGYAPFEVLDADQDERVEGVVLAEFPPFEQTVAWFNGDAYVQARKDRTEGNEYLGMVVDSGVASTSKRSAGTPAYVVFVCRENFGPGGAQYVSAACEWNVGGSSGSGLN